MSRTYRTPCYPVEFCNLCENPVWYAKIVGYGESCSCYKKSPRSLFSNPTYQRHDMKCRDGSNVGMTGGDRKYWQNYRNRKLRRKTKNILKSRDFEDAIFPIVKKEVDWDVW